MSRVSDLAGKIFDDMDETKQDMPRSVFVREMCRLSDQKGMDADLGRIMSQKRISRNRQVLGDATKRAIDRVT